MANMTADPAGAPRAPYPWIQDAYERGDHKQRPAEFARTMRPEFGRGGPVSKEDRDRAMSEYQQLQEYAQQRERWAADEARRRAATEASFRPSQGPAPINQAAAAPARRY
jgi:hypothetical protein